MAVRHEDLLEQPTQPPVVRVPVAVAVRVRMPVTVVMLVSVLMRVSVVMVAMAMRTGVVVAVGVRMPVSVDVSIAVVVPVGVLVVVRGRGRVAIVVVRLPRLGRGHVCIIPRARRRRKPCPQRPAGGLPVLGCRIGYWLGAEPLRRAAACQSNTKQHKRLRQS
jgi:hypothetical protein